MQLRPSVSVAESRVREALCFVKKHDRSCVEIGLVGYFGSLLHHHFHQHPREYGHQNRNAVIVSLADYRLAEGTCLQILVSPPFNIAAPVAVQV